MRAGKGGEVGLERARVGGGGVKWSGLTVFVPFCALLSIAPSLYGNNRRPPPDPPPPPYFRALCWVLAL